MLEIRESLYMKLTERLKTTRVHLPANSRKVTQIRIVSPGVPPYGRREIRGKDTMGDFSPMVLHLVRYDRV